MDLAGTTRPSIGTNWDLTTTGIDPISPIAITDFGARKPVASSDAREPVQHRPQQRRRRHPRRVLIADARPLRSVMVPGLLHVRPIVRDQADAQAGSSDDALDLALEQTPAEQRRVVKMLLLCLARYARLLGKR